MSFLSPLAALLAAALTLPPLVALYLLKRRRREVVIASTLLWRSVLRELEVNAPMQKLRRNLLLFLQLLVLLALLLAFAGPVVSGEALGGRRVVILVDRSASMNGPAEAGTRLEAARRRAESLIAAAGEGGAMVVSFDDAARVVAPLTTDRAALGEAVAGIGPSERPGRIEPAFELLRPLTGGGEGEEGPPTTVFIVSDGGFADADRARLPDAELHYLPVGVAAPNAGIAAFEARRHWEDPRRVELMARLVHVGPAPLETVLRLAVDGKERARRRVRLAPAGPGDALAERMVSFELEMAGGGLLELEMQDGGALAADDRAALVLGRPSELRVLLVTGGNPFLERAIEASGPERLEVTGPDGWAKRSADEVRAGFDVVVFDGYRPETVPPVPSLSLGAAPPIEGLEQVAWDDSAPRVQRVLDWDRDHPVMREVALDHLVIEKPGRLRLPPDARPLAMGGSGPLMAEVAAGSNRHLVSAFDVFSSNWPMQVSFSIFVAASLETLGLGGRERGSGMSFATGAAASVPVAGDRERVVFEGPVRLEAPVARGQAALPVFERAGIYRARAGVPEPWDRLAVNLVDAGESDLRPVETLSFGRRGAGRNPETASRDVGATLVQRSVHHLFLWAALAILLLEWWLYTRRMRGGAG